MSTSTGARALGKVNRLGYVGVSARDMDAWRAYSAEVLGHQVGFGSDDENLYLRMDEHHHRLTVHPSDADDVAYVGWDVGSTETMQAIAAKLEARSIPVKAGTPEEAADRRVIDFVHFHDPHSDLRWELHYGPEVIFHPPYHPQRAISGFKTGDGGMGHFVTYVQDAEAAARFYEDVLGFRVSDWVVVPGIGKIGAFMHCNTRHHSLAFFVNPAAQRHVHHVMLEQTSIDDVGSGYDICLERELVTATLGRHLNDHMLSFYFKNPGDWHFEIGWNAREINPETWQVEHYNGLTPGGGEWGHKGIHDVL